MWLSLFLPERRTLFLARLQPGASVLFSFHICATSTGRSECGQTLIAKKKNVFVNAIRQTFAVGNVIVFARNNSQVHENWCFFPLYRKSPNSWLEINYAKTRIFLTARRDKPDQEMPWKLPIFKHAQSKEEINIDDRPSVFSYNIFDWKFWRRKIHASNEQVSLSKLGHATIMSRSDNTLQQQK